MNMVSPVKSLVSAIKYVRAMEKILAQSIISELDCRVAFDKLQQQLPEGMRHCTIRFIECPVGHGRLHADNWVPTECPWCEIKALREKIIELTVPQAGDN